MSAQANLIAAVAALVADVNRRGETVGKVVHAEMTELEKAFFDALIAAGGLTVEEEKGAYIEYESILEFGDHVAVFYDVPEPMPAAQYDELLRAAHQDGDKEAEAKLQAYLDEHPKCLRVAMDGTWICL